MDGGVIYNGCQKEGSVSCEIIDCNFERNGSNNGGCIFTYNHDGNDKLLIQKTSFNNNTANARGGAFYYFSINQSPIELINCQFDNNSATISHDNIYDYYKDKQSNINRLKTQNTKIYKM